MSRQIGCLGKLFSATEKCSCQECDPLLPYDMQSPRQWQVMGELAVELHVFAMLNFNIVKLKCECQCQVICKWSDLTCLLLSSLALSNTNKSECYEMTWGEQLPHASLKSNSLSTKIERLSRNCVTHDIGPPSPAAFQKRQSSWHLGAWRFAQAA